jgi:site-specific recombinase XerD
MAHLIKRNKIFHIRYKHNSKWVKKSLKTSDPKLAKRALLDYQLIETKNAGLNFIIIDKTVKEIFELYTQDILNNENYKNKTDKTKRTEMYIIPTLERFFEQHGIILISKITPYIVKKFQSERSKSIGPWTVNREVTVLGAILNYAISKKYINENSAKGIGNLKTTKKIFRYMSKEEIDKLFDTTREYMPWWLPAIGLGYYAGFRKSEALFCEFRDINFEENIIVSLKKFF